jgi:hypothetical protein
VLIALEQKDLRDFFGAGKYIGDQLPKGGAMLEPWPDPPPSKKTLLCPGCMSKTKLCLPHQVGDIRIPFYALSRMVPNRQLGEFALHNKTKLLQR